MTNFVQSIWAKSNQINKNKLFVFIFIVPFLFLFIEAEDEEKQNVKWVLEKK